MDLVLLLIGITPIFWFGPQPDFMSQQLYFMHYMAALMLACVLCNRWLGGFLMLTLAHKFLIPAQMAAWIDYVLPLSIGCLIYHLVFTYYKGKKYPYVVLALLIFNLAIAGLQALRLPYLSQQLLEPDGMLSLPSFLGMVFAMTAPIILTIHPALIVVSLLGIIISKSAFSALAFIAGVFFYAWSVYPKKRKIFVCLVIVMLAIVPVVKHGYKSDELSRRLHVWPMVASKAFHSMWTGVGAGNDCRTMFLEFSHEGRHYYFQVNVKPENQEVLKHKILNIAKMEGMNTDRLENVFFKQPDIFPIIGNIQDDLRGQGMNGYIWGHCHNEYLQLFLNFGVLGLVLLAGYVWNMWQRYRRTFLKSKETIALMGSAIAIGILSMAHFPFYLPKTVCLIIVFMAILDRKLSQTSRSIL